MYLEIVYFLPYRLVYFFSKIISILLHQNISLLTYFSSMSPFYTSWTPENSFLVFKEYKMGTFVENGLICSLCREFVLLVGWEWRKATLFLKKTKNKFNKLQQFFSLGTACGKFLIGHLNFKLNPHLQFFENWIEINSNSYEEKVLSI